MKKKIKDISRLKEIAKKTRLNIISMLARAGSGHPGGSLSAVEIIVALYYSYMNHDPENPKWDKRDRLVLSKGHSAPALYSVLCDLGYFERWHLEELRRLGSILQGHPDMHLTPGIDLSSGSLGQGLSVACGMAAAAKIDKKKHRVYCILGDGEVQEGQIWEAAMSASHYKLDNLCAILDKNELQIDGPVKKIMNIDDISEKFRSFGWHTEEIDGHDFPHILKALDKASKTKGKPYLITAHTVKGKGVSFMEHKIEFHGTSPTPQKQTMPWVN